MTTPDPHHALSVAQQLREDLSGIRVLLEHVVKTQDDIRATQRTQSDSIRNIERDVVSQGVQLTSLNKNLDNMARDVDELETRVNTIEKQQAGVAVKVAVVTSVGIALAAEALKRWVGGH